MTQDELKRRLRYDPETGFFTWLVKPCRNRQSGSVAGNISRGRIDIQIRKERFLAHRLAWLYMTGFMPAGEIDHINGDGADNRWKNLRSVTHKMNAQNKRKAQVDNQTGFLGVSPDRNKFRATIFVDGKHKYLGSYYTPQEAHQVYVLAKRRYHAGNTL